MHRYKIFISAVQKELKAERRAVKDFVRSDVLLSEYFDAFLFEDAPAKSKSAEKAYLEEVCKSDIGSGTLEMMKQCKAQGLPEPEFISERNLEFKTILARDIFTEPVLAQMGFNARQLKAIKYVKQKGKITNSEYQDVLGVGKRQATNDLNELEKKAVIVRHGKTGRGTYYALRGTKGA